jgi:cardiolipin synthase A/B
MTERKASQHFSEGHRLDLLKGGVQFFPAAIAAIDAAGREVWMETYIFEPDASGKQVADALMRAAQRGVHVRLVVDGFGAGDHAQALRTQLSAAGVEFGVFSPVKSLLGMFFGKQLRRLHRKLLMIDGQLAFCGGINVLDDFWDPNHGALEQPRLDFAVQLQGPLVPVVRDSMERMWWRVDAFGLMRDRQFKTAMSAMRDAPQQFRHWASGTRANWENTWSSWQQQRNDPGWEQRSLLPEHGSDQRDMRAAFLLRDNVTNRRRIEGAYLAAIRSARREIFIANAYFLPGRRVRKALQAAVKRGVTVKLLLQGRYEYFVQYYATHAIYDFLLNSGMQVYEYKASFLHAKVAVIDSRWSTVGSSNLDPLSMLLAYEANVVIDSARFASELRGALIEAMDEGATQLDAASYSKRGLSKRMLNWLAYGLFRLGVAITGKRY